MISRQQKYQMKQKALNRCIACGGELNTHTRFCDKCVVKRASSVKKYLKKYRSENREKINKYNREWTANKRKIERQSPIYVFGPELTYSNFKKIWKRFPETGGLTSASMAGGKLIWGMIIAKKLIVYIDPLRKDDPVIFALKLPKRKILVMTNPKKEYL